MNLSLRQQALDFVQFNGPKTHTEIKKFMYETQHPGKIYDPVENRGWYCSYFSDSNRWFPWLPMHMNHLKPKIKEAIFSRGTKADPRYLTKIRGKYIISTAPKNSL